MDRVRRALSDYRSAIDWVLSETLRRANEGENPLDELVGSPEELLTVAKSALATGDNQWACQLLDYLIALDPEGRDLKRLKANALRHLAVQQTSSNARHYYLSCAEELENDGFDSSFTK
jgi:alkyl sulfatase BDS1-like metallo-beta-lactamase superfamily hydrolase